MRDQSVAPKERINIVYKPATGDATEQMELPLKLLMVGDYRLRPDDRLLEEREPINVDKDNFEQVMREQKLELSMNVEDRLSGEEDAELAVKLKVDTMKDFEPESIVQQVPELNQLMELRMALQGLKSPLADNRDFVKKLQQLLADDEAREKLLGELGLGEDGAAASGDDS